MVRRPSCKAGDFLYKEGERHAPMVVIPVWPYRRGTRHRRRPPSDGDGGTGDVHWRSRSLGWTRPPCERATSRPGTLSQATSRASGSIRRTRRLVRGRLHGDHAVRVPGGDRRRWRQLCRAGGSVPLKTRQARSYVGSWPATRPGRCGVSGSDANAASGRFTRPGSRADAEAACATSDVRQGVDQLRNRNRCSGGALESRRGATLRATSPSLG